MSIGLGRDIINKGKAMKDFIAAISLLILIASIPAAWFTHVFVCLANESWGFLIAGAIVIPIAVIHGYGIWIGVF